MKKIAMLFAVGLALVQPNFLWAQAATAPAKQQPCHPRQGNPDGRKAMHEYMKSEIVPQLQKIHQQFDAQLSAADLAFLQKKRAEAQALREDRRELRHDIHKACEQGQNPAEFKDDRRAMREKFQAIEQDMADFNKRNAKAIENLNKQLEPLAAKARTKRAEIEQQYPRPANDDQRPHPHKDGHRGKEGTEALRGLPHFADDATKFMLWNGQTPEHEPRRAERNPINDAPQAAPALKIYPNPASAQSNIEFALTQPAQSVQLDLRDMQGKTVRTQRWSQLGAGQQRAQLDLQGLPSGQYVYTLAVDGKMSTQRLTIE